MASVASSAGSAAAVDDHRRCWICSASSGDPCPYQQHADEHRVWNGLMPWDQGTHAEPRGQLCKLCRTVWSCGDWAAKYTSLPGLKAAKKNDPTVIHTFLAQRKALVDMKQSNPSIRLRDRGALAAQAEVCLLPVVFC